METFSIFWSYIRIDGIHFWGERDGPSFGVEEGGREIEVAVRPEKLKHYYF
jgi:hypothetical protein